MSAHAKSDTGKAAADTLPSATKETASPVLECVDIVQEFRVRQRGTVQRATVSAVAGVSFSIQRGETFAVVGETGSGKSTLARAIVGDPPPLRGTIKLNGRVVQGRRERGRLVSMIFQDPMSGIDPRWSVERIVSEPLRVLGKTQRGERRRRVAEVLDVVGLSAHQYADRRPKELSGGQAQRVAIARALVASPQLVICDEPVTALDVSTQAQILELLQDLKCQYGLTYLLIAHDLSVVRALADRTATMHLGCLCEEGETAAVFKSPAHPYTAALLSAIPPRGKDTATRSRIRLLGEPPSPLRPPTGCRFHTRCTYAQQHCSQDAPEVVPLRSGQRVACFFPLPSPTAAQLSKGPSQ